MKNYETLAIAVPVALILGLGGSACSADYDRKPDVVTPSTTCATIEGLTEVRLIGPAKKGGTNAVNGGECVGMYDPRTFRAVGELAAGGAFIIECVDGPKPPSFSIHAGDLNGDVQLADPLIQQLQDGEFGDIPNCPQPA